MRYTDDYEHNPILGKAGDWVDILSRVPADTDVVLHCNNILSDNFNAQALNISLSDYRPFEHTIKLKDDGFYGLIICCIAIVVITSAIILNDPYVDRTYQYKVIDKRETVGSHFSIANKGVRTDYNITFKTH